MSQTETAHAWWSRLRHQGLLLSPVVMIERYPEAPPDASFHAKNRLRDAQTRFASTLGEGGEADPAAILSFVDSLLETFVGHPAARLAKQHSIPEKLTVPVRIGSKTETIRPHRVLYADDSTGTTALLVMADPSSQVGRGRGRTTYAHLLELLRGTGHRLGLLTNGQQFRLVYAGLDFESWCEWESDRWFDDGEGTEELLGLRQLLSPDSLKPIKEGVSGLLDGVEESRKRQADLSSVLRENVRQAVEHLLDEVSNANRTNAALFNSLVQFTGDRKLTDTEAYEALMQATVRVVMRLVVCLFAESRQLLPVNDPIYDRSYGVRTLYELLDEATRCEGGTHVLFNRQTAWPRLMALFRLVHGGSSHGAFPLRPYGGVLFRPGDEASSDPVARALHILEYNVTVADATIYYVLRKLLRGPLPVIKGKSKTFVEGPVDYTDLRTEFIGLIYEGLLDYRVKRTDEQIGPQVFLNIGREPVLPLSRLTDMLTSDKKGLKDLLTTLRKEKVTATAADEEDGAEADEEGDDAGGEEESNQEVAIEAEATDEVKRTGDYLDAVESANGWAKEAVALAGLVSKQGTKETDAEYQTRIEGEAKKLIKRVVANGEFYLVRAGNTRKGTGTFYTRPQLAVPTTHRTLEPLCYDKSENGPLTPKTPEVILGLKVCDPACGSASFLVAALHYLTDALYKSLCHHKKLDDPAQSKKITLPFGRPRTNTEAHQLVPFPPNDNDRGHIFEERVKALLRRHVVERCIYGVDINPLAVELARVSLWVETLDPELPFSFLDHKIKVGNSLVGCWVDRVEDYPLKAWEREGGDGKDGPRTLRIETLLKGDKIGNRRSGDGRIKQEMRQVIESKFSKQSGLFPDLKLTTESVVTEARARYEKVHDLPLSDPDERERYYREHVESSPALRTLKAAMDEWCAVWFWPTDEESLKHVPTPLTFHKASEQKETVVDGLRNAKRFFHWELEFPDVFSAQGSGFHGVLGNPPWEVMKPISQEFFTEFDPLYRTYDKQTAIRNQQQLFAEVPGVKDRWEEYNASFKALSNWVKNAAHPFDLPLERGSRQSELAASWAKARSHRRSFSAAEKPFSFQGGADLNLYKLFLEISHHLLSQGGRMGLIVPSGLYTDAGCHDLRDLFLSRSTWDWLFGFINWEQIFSIYYRFKFVVSIIERRPSPTGHAIHSCFGRYKLRDWEEADEVVFPLPKSNVLEFSPKTLSILEITSQRDLRVCRKIYGHSFRVGDGFSGWELRYAAEFHMTNDSKLFKPREWWEAKSYKPDVFGRWIGPDGDVALPLYEGRMTGQYDCAEKGYVSGRGRSAVWCDLSADHKKLRPQFLMQEATFQSSGKGGNGWKLIGMSIASSTNNRTVITSCQAGFPCNHALFTLRFDSSDVMRCLLLQGVFNSLVFDFTTRQRVGGLNLSWFILEECPLPLALTQRSDSVSSRVLLNSLSLTLVHRRFAPEWLRLKSIYTALEEREWKHWWAVTESDRLRLRVQNEALVACLYGIDVDDFEWIVHHDPEDPKGFWRVDKQLPYRERFTGLAAATFRALKEGKWSAESAATLSNDEFFEILGIPELTNAEAAKAKGESDPLILRRNGCHVWEPESFSADDPRHGWTWDDCWKDAVALLGSEDAVRKYIAGEPAQPAEVKPEPTGAMDLFGNPIPVKPKQKRLF
jgi:hypothetical protein